MSNRVVILVDEQAPAEAVGGFPVRFAQRVKELMDSAERVSLIRKQNSEPSVEIVAPVSRPSAR